MKHLTIYDRYDHNMKFGILFLGHYMYNYLPIQVCRIYAQQKRRGIFKKLGTFTISVWPIWPCPSTRTPVPGVMKFTISVDPSLVIITDAYRIVCLIHAQDKRRRFFKRYINFTLFTPKSSPLGVMVMKLIISYLFTLQTIHTKFGQN